MTKSDLKDGMIVEVRNGYTYQFHRKLNRALGVFGEAGMVLVSSWEDDLTCIHNHDFDVVAVYSLTNDVVNLYSSSEFNDCECIWRREEPKTLEERVEIMEKNIKTIMDTLEDLK